MKKKGISPVIATVLLIAIVVVIALIIFLWARSFISEVVMKQGRAAEQVCQDINLEASLSGSELSVINRGNIPVYSLDVRKMKAGSKEKERLEQVELGPGQSDVYEIEGQDWEKVELIPTVLGEVGNSKKEFICEKKVIEVEKQELE